MSLKYFLFSCTSQLRDKFLNICFGTDLEALAETLAGFMNAVNRNAEYRCDLFCGETKARQCCHSLLSQRDVRKFLFELYKKPGVNFFEQEPEFGSVFLGQNGLQCKFSNNGLLVGRDVSAFYLFF